MKPETQELIRSEIIAGAGRLPQLRDLKVEFQGLGFRAVAYHRGVRMKFERDYMNDYEAYKDARKLREESVNTFWKMLQRIDEGMYYGEEF